MALRLKYAGWPAESIEVDAGDRGLARPRRRRGARAGSSPCPPTPPCSSCASCSPTAAWRRSSGDERERPVIWHDVECGAYSADLALWEELAARGRRPGPRPRLRHRPGRPPPGPARAPGRSALDLDPELIAALARARRRACRCEAVVGDARELRARATSSPWCWRRCSWSSCSPARAERLDCLRCVAAAPAPGGRVALAIVEGMPAAGRRRRRRCPTCARSTAGSTPACRSTPVDVGEEIVDPAPAPDRLARRRAERGGERDPHPQPLAAERARGARASRPGCGRCGRRQIAPTDLHVGSTVVVLREGRPDGAARPQPLPGADEHLRRPRQHRLPAAALRVARDRLRPRRRRARASASTPPPTTSSTSAAARTATSAWSPPTWSRASARRSPRRSRRRRRCSPSAAATSCSATATSSARRRLPGLGLADLETVREPGPRLIGNVAIEVDLGAGPRLLAGFENHGGRTYLGPGAQPLGRVRQGLRQQRRGRPRGRAPRQPDRHLPARPAAAEERLARRPPDRARARAPLRRPPRARAARRRLRGAPPTRAPAPRPAL